MSNAMTEIFGEVIHSYTREQALEDGVLVDLNAGDLAGMPREAGFTCPVACTARVFFDCVALTPAAERAGNDIKGRAWDVLWLMAVAVRIARAKGVDRFAYTVRVVRERVRPTPTELVAVIGPGDDGAPVITIMYPDED